MVENNKDFEKEFALIGSAVDREYGLEYLCKIGVEKFCDIRKKIIEDITNINMEFYAPDYNSWMDKLQEGKSNEYREVLKIIFDEAQLEILWKYTHLHCMKKSEMNKMRVSYTIG